MHCLFPPTKGKAKNHTSPTHFNLGENFKSYEEMRVDLHELQKATRTSKLWAKKLDSLTLGTNLQPTKKNKETKRDLVAKGLAS